MPGNLIEGERFSRRDFLRAAAAVGGGLAATAIERVLTALAAPLEGGGVDPVENLLSQLPQETRDILSSATPFDVKAIQDIHGWSGPGMGYHKFEDVHIPTGGTAQGLALTDENRWVFGLVTQKDPETGQPTSDLYFFSGDSDYVELPKDFQFRVLNPDQVRQIQKVQWPDLPAEPVSAEQPTSKETAVGQEVFRSKYGDGILECGGVISIMGTVVEITPDPEGKRGNVMRVTIAGDPVQNWEWGGGLFWRTGYTSWQNGDFQTLPAPCAIEVDCYVPKKGLPNDMGLLSVHRRNKNTGARTSVAGLELYKGGYGGLPVLLVRDGGGNDTRQNLLYSAFKLDTWNRIRMEFLPDGTVIPIVNGRNAYIPNTPILKVPVDADHDAGFCDGHGGFIWANANASRSPTQGFYMYNADFKVIQL